MIFKVTNIHTMQELYLITAFLISCTVLYLQHKPSDGRVSVLSTPKTVIMSFCFTVPIIEEVIFRHFLLEYIHIPIWNAEFHAYLFALSHLSNNIILGMGYHTIAQPIIAYLMGYYIITTKNFSGAIITHCLYNSGVCLMEYILKYLMHLPNSRHKNTSSESILINTGKKNRKRSLSFNNRDYKELSDFTFVSSASIPDNLMQSLKLYKKLLEKRPLSLNEGNKLMN